MSNASSSDADPFGVIVEKFLDELREGKHPAIEDFARRYPDHAEKVRAMLPALAAIDQARSQVDADGRPHRPSAAASRSGAEGALPQLGDYHLLREIGRGGMGVVYEAQQLSLGRHVALKVLPSHTLLGPRQLGRFHREARAAARLHHTNIVPVFGVGEQDGVHYYVMQYIDGLGLDAVLSELRQLRQTPAARQASPSTETTALPASSPSVSAANVALSLLTASFPGSDFPPATGPTARPAESSPFNSSPIPLPGQLRRLSLSEPGRSYWRSVARIGIQVAEALAHALSQGVLHRDIKPSNLLLDEKGNVWVTDFGLAKADDDGDGLTQTGDIVGTLRYMAPERFNGQCDVRSDIYALGLSLYELLALRPAFEDADRNQLIKSILNEEPPRLRKIHRDIPADLETVVLKAIAHEPAQRYQTPADLAADLQRFLEDRPILARRVSAAEQLWRWCKRNPLPAFCVSLVLLILVGALVVVSDQLWQKEQQRKQADTARQQAQQERDRAAATLYYSQLARVRLELEANQVTGARQALQLCDPQRRGWEWQLLHEICHPELLTLEGNTGWICAVAWSPDGKHIASAGTGNPFHQNRPERIQPGEIILWDADTGQRLRTLRGHKHNLRAATFSPDGKRLASCSDDQTVRLWDADSGRQLPLSASEGLSVADVAFRPDGRQLVAAGTEGQVLRWDLDSGRALPPWKCEKGLRSVVFSPDGKWLAAEGLIGKIVLLDTTRAIPAATIEASTWGEKVGGPVFSPDSRTLAAPSGENGIGLWEIPSGKLLRVLTGHQGGVNGLVFSADGLFLASTSQDTTVRLWKLRHEHDEPQRTRVLRGHTDQTNVAAFSPDAQRLVSGGRDGELRVWDLTRDAEHGEVSLTVDPESAVEAIAFGAEGRELLLVSRGGQIDILESGTHRFRRRILTNLTSAWKSPGQLASIDAQGQRLAGISKGDGKLAVCWDLETGQERVFLHGHTVPLSNVVLSANGRRIATAGVEPRSEGLFGEIRVWDAESGQLLWQRSQRGLWPRRLALSPDGTILAVSALWANLTPKAKEPAISSSFVQVYDAEDGRVRHTFEGLEDRNFLGLGISPNGNLLALAGGESEKLVVWNLADGRKLVETRQAPPLTMDVAFSPDGKRLAVASRLQLKLLDADTGEEMLLLRGISQLVPNSKGYNPSVRFSADGKRLLAVCNNSPYGIAEWSVEDSKESDAPGKRVEAIRYRGIARWLRKRPVGEEPEEPVFRYRYEHVAGCTPGTPWEYSCRAPMHLRAGRPDAALADSLKALELAPADRDLCGTQADLFIRLAALDQGAAAFANASRACPGGWWNGILQADLELLRGDRKAYLRLCREMLQRFGDTAEPEAAVAIAIHCLSAGTVHELGMDRRLAEQLAERTVTESDRRGYVSPLVAYAKALAERSSGHPEAARDWLARGESISKIKPLCGFQALVLLNGALREQREGKVEAARDLLARANEQLKQAWPLRPKALRNDEMWWVWVHCQPSAGGSRRRWPQPLRTVGPEPRSPLYL